MLQERVWHRFSAVEVCYLLRFSVGSASRIRESYSYSPVGGREEIPESLGSSAPKDGVLPSPRLPLLAGDAEVAKVARHATSRVVLDRIAFHQCKESYQPPCQVSTVFGIEVCLSS